MRIAVIPSPALIPRQRRLYTGFFFPAGTGARMDCFRGTVGIGYNHPSLENQEGSMLYAILCYNDENVVGSWTKEEDDACMARLKIVQDKVAKQGRLGPVVRLLPTTAATTLRKGGEAPLIIDGPFAETKEQLLGFYLVDCANLDEALAFARELAEANPDSGSYEIRPLRLFRPSELAR
jgi:hypothetical protein